MHAGFLCRRAPARARPVLAAAFLSLAFAVGPVHAHTPAAHVHGEATLNVTVDGAQLELQLEAPLDSLLGFEHAPRTAAQREAVRAMAARLRQAQSLFEPTPEAGCSLASVRLASSSLPAELLGEAAAKAAGAAEGEHADLDATFSYRCAAPQRLRGLASGLQKAFPGIGSLKVRVASGRGQKATVLSRGRTTVQW